MELLLTALLMLAFLLLGYFIGRREMENELIEFVDFVEAPQPTQKRGRKHLCHCGRKFNTFKGKRIHQGRSH